MTLTPVILRELRAQAHSPVTWRLRLLAAGLAIGGFALLVSPTSWVLAGRGDMAFGVLNSFAAFVIALICPALTADSISREKREGTLGLLFLTPLSAKEIVLGKALTHALRALLLWLAAAPVLLLPVLQGGVSAGMVAAVLAGHAALISVSLSSGLMASALTRQPGAALAAAYAVLVITGLAFGMFVGPLAGAVATLADNLASVVGAALVMFIAVSVAVWIHVAIAARSVRPDGDLLEPSSAAVRSTRLRRPQPSWSNPKPVGTPSTACQHSPWGHQPEEVSAGKAWIPSREVPFVSDPPDNVGTRWNASLPAQDVTAPPALISAPRALLPMTPVCLGWKWLVAWLAMRRRQLLDRHPLEWLFTRPSGELSIEAQAFLCALAVGYFGLLMIAEGGQPTWIAVGLMAAMWLTAGGGLREEQRNGAFEMFGVLPLTAGAALRAQTAKMSRLFLPALLLCGILDLVAEHKDGSSTISPVLVAAWLAVLTLPALGVWAALNTQHPAVGSLGIAGAAWGVPFLACETFKLVRYVLGVSESYSPGETNWNPRALMFLSAHAVVGALAWWAARRALVHRGFLLRCAPV